MLDVVQVALFKVVRGASRLAGLGGDGPSLMSEGE